MNEQFDRLISRRGTGSLRWDTVEERYGEPDLIPLTTADMDFPAPPPIREALQRAVEFGIFGYTRTTASYYDAVISRFSTHWHWEIQPDWIVHSPGVVGAVACCVQGMTAPGDGIVLPTPMYHPFAHVIADNDRTLLRSPLAERDGTWVLDFESLERQLSDPQAKILLFCNPHNPIGRAWRYDELYQVCQLCLKHGVVLISDEIHCDFIFSGHRFTSAAAPMIELGGLDQLIVCSSASKSFNLAGLQTSNIIIPGKSLRDRFCQVQNRLHMNELNMLGPVATEAAYRHCDDWLVQAMTYLEGNRDFITTFLRDRGSLIRPVVPEATYLSWLDCRPLGLNDAQLEHLFLHRAKVGVNMGYSFGSEGSGFVRLNFAIPRQLLEQALDRIAAATSAL